MNRWGICTALNHCFQPYSTNIVCVRLFKYVNIVTSSITYSNFISFFCWLKNGEYAILMHSKYFLDLVTFSSRSRRSPTISNGEKQSFKVSPRWYGLQHLALDYKIQGQEVKLHLATLKSVLFLIVLYPYCIKQSQGIFRLFSDVVFN